MLKIKFGDVMGICKIVNNGLINVFSFFNIFYVKFFIGDFWFVKLELFGKWNGILNVIKLGKVCI